MNTLYICVFDCHDTTCSLQFNIGQRKKTLRKAKKKSQTDYHQKDRKKNRYIIMSNFCVIDDISANLPDLVT